MTNAEIAVYKGQGFLKQKEGDLFAARMVSRAGHFTAKEVVLLASLAEKYGNGEVTTTSRLSIEIPGIKFEDIEKFKAECDENNLIYGGTGPRVRPISACKGTVCQSGLYDVTSLSQEIFDEFYGRKLPAKFKITLSGCPNNCAKAQINDIGVVGYRKPKINLDLCVGCGNCQRVCKEKDVVIENRKAVFDKETCVNCGKCIEACKFGAIETDEEGVVLTIGGTFGRRLIIGKRIPKVFAPSEVVPAIAKIIDYYEKNAEGSERFSKVIKRLGEEKVMSDILSLF